MERSRVVELSTIGLSFFALGVSVSVALTDRGVSDGLVVGAALIVHSATSELAYVAVSDAGGSVVAGVLSGWLVSSRFGVFAAALSTRLNPARLDISGLERVAAGLNAFDPNVTLALQERDDDAARRVFWQTTLVMMVGWWVGSIAGVLLGNVLGDTERIGLDMVFPAALLSIIGNQLRNGDALLAAIVGASVVLALFPVAPAGLPILLSVVGAGVGVGYSRRHRAHTDGTGGHQ